MTKAVNSSTEEIFFSEKHGFGIYFNQKALVLNSEGKILALKAAYKKFQWDLPGGGVQLPERAIDALRREIREETGLEVDNVEPMKVETAMRDEKDWYIILIVYRCTALSDQVTLSEEHAQYAWVTPEEFLHLDAIPYQRDIVQSLFGKNTQN